MLCVLIAFGWDFQLKSWPLTSLTSSPLRHGLGGGQHTGVEDFSLPVSIVSAAPDFQSNVAESLGRVGLSFPEISSWEGDDPR